ncbi:hypothetical protein [Methanogenium cariaci]|uniref:hypothetical protein n=1 Tax=Methanogenium cariaci TaxID=2197 RepID=UPI001FE110B1|nr:hypothetical protein [Methanogenium cariaci]
MKTIVISLGGSVLVPDIENNNIKQYRDLLSSLKDTCRIFIVVGGGEAKPAAISVQHVI